MIMRTLTIFLLLLLVSKPSIGQDITVLGGDHPIYKLESRLMNGERSALYEIAEYFDSKKELMESLGYHIRENDESEIAKRIVKENSLFTEKEFVITDSSTTKQFLDFLNLNKDKIFFSKLASSFLITPINKRTVNFEIRSISKEKIQELNASSEMLLGADWVKENKIDSLIKQRNSISLLKISSEFFKKRNRFNRYHFNEEEFTNLLQYLTGTEIGVEHEYGNKKIYWLIKSRLNLLIYFSKYYSQYNWDEKKSIFAIPNQEIKAIEKEDLLFQLLSSKNDSIAIDAFTQLTVCNPDKVTQLADEYRISNTDESYAIPIFPHKFLKQLVWMTEYCKANDIDFVGTKDLQRNISLLQTQLSFAERRKLEDKLINSLTLDEITAFEYWALIYEQSWRLTYSAGRILDIFYSKNWNKLITSDKHLIFYLKKSTWFDNLGIIGICNNYLKKFSGSPQSTLTRLITFQKNDNNISLQIEKIISQNNHPDSTKEKGIVSWDGNIDNKIEGLKKQLDRLISNVKDSSKTDDAISTILSQIDYSQIPTALKAIEEYPFKTKWKKYSFMERDWGFFMAGDFEKQENRDEFLRLYSKFSEYQLYAYYLEQASIDYTTENKLDYDKIYELLKYNVVVAFAGGGGGTQDNEVYSLVKLLEITFQTTLGYPRKFCNSNNMYGCDSDERAKSWMKYFEENNLLKQKHDEPISFHYE